MASTTSPNTGFFSSPRAQRALYWVSGIVFLAGVVAIITVYATRGNSTPAAVNNSSGPSQPVTPVPKTVKPAHDALGVARRFLETAVVRKNLAESYNLVGPMLKSGITLKQWETGNNTVVPYPATNTKTTALVVKASNPKALVVQAALVPPVHSNVKPQAFLIEIDKVGGRWLVNNFQPVYHAPLLNGQQ